MGVVRLGELSRDEIADALERRSADCKTIRLRFHGELAPPKLGELLGAARHQGLRGQNAGQLAIEGISLGPFLDRALAAPARR